MVMPHQKLQKLLLSALAAFSSLATASHLDSIDRKVPTHDANGKTSHKVEHRLAPEIYSQSPFASQSRVVAYKAPNPGSTAAASNRIVYQGGAIMNGVSKIVVIWYGNWNQSNNADTPFMIAPPW